ncbi:MAG TPA: hypothetical protein VJ818_09305 [Actinomycetota bacterium]|nr:hypothetical protein [Actinomycetota bacterium]
MATQRRIRPGHVLVPTALAVVIALAAFSYVTTRATIVRSPAFAVPGAIATGNAFTVDWRTGTDIAIIASFTASHRARIRSVTIDGLDPKDAFVETSEYALSQGPISLPTFQDASDPLPATLDPHTLVGAFTVPAHTRVIVRLVVHAIADATVNEVLTGIHVDAESWSWAHSTYIPFEQPVKLQRAR